MFRAPLRMSALALGLTAGLAAAQPATPTYSFTYTDATTGDNAFIAGGFRYYTIDPGADRYQNDIYERPIAQAFQLVGANYASEEYHSYVDVERARLGWDANYLYASIDLVGLEKRTKDGVNSIEGLKAKYLLRIGTDADGRNSWYFMADEPGFAGTPSTVFTNAKTEGWKDTDLDVGGRGGPIHGQPGPSGVNVTKVQNPLEEFGMNGYDAQVILSDGIFNGGAGQLVMWQRVSPADPTVVEIAIDYVSLGLTQVDLQNLRFVDFAAVAGGPAGPENGLWNDKYTGIEAGSPNLGIGTDNEFGTQGLGTIYLADNVRGTVAPICDPDFNQDGNVDQDDILALVTAIGGGPNPAGFDLDFNRDGNVDQNDVSALVDVVGGGQCP
ncbi:MAG: hypothetical protein SFY69_00915 [Planctomycetota bacterium]|nr:hypothetical protein [Planctomycetota bacterium]